MSASPEALHALACARRDAAASSIAVRAAEILRHDVASLAADPDVVEALAGLVDELALVPGVDRRSAPRR